MARCRGCSACSTPTTPAPSAADPSTDRRGLDRTFTTAGTYTLTLIADDGEYTASATHTISVEAEQAGPVPTAEVFEATLNKKWTEQSFTIQSAGGSVFGELVFSTKANKRTPAPELTLRVIGADGTVLATASDGSPVGIALDLPVGPVTWEVSGDRTSFSLTVTYQAD